MLRTNWTCPLFSGHTLYFVGRTITAAQLLAFLGELSAIQLPSGRATDRLVVAGIERETLDGIAMSKIRLVGTEEDIRLVQEILESMKGVGAGPQRNSQADLAHLADLPIGKLIPERIERSRPT